MAISAGSVAAFLTLDTSGFDGALKQSRALMDSLQSDSLSVGEKISAVGKTMTSVGTDMTLKVTTPIVAAGIAVTKTFTSFDDAIRQVQATMAAGEEDTEKLTAAAKKYGAETRYSATQAAEALNYLALAGYNADQAIAALPTVLQLAQAGALDLGYASDLVTDSMSALGLEMGELGTFSDQMAKTAQKSNTNISQLGQAILTVGGTAKSLSGGTAELNALLGILADNGIKGAEGGTHLRNVLLSLQTPTKEGAQLLDELTNGVYDAEGNMRSLDVVLQELNASMDGMTDQEKQNIISTIFNKTDLAAVQALLGGCGDRFAELYGYIIDSEGAAAEMAATMEGGIGGSFRSLASAIEAVAIAFGETLAPNVKAAADWLTEAARKFSELDAGARNTIVTTAGVVAAIGPALVVGGKLVTLIGSIVSGAKVIGAVMSGPAGWIALGVAGLAALCTWANRSRSELEGVNDALAESNREGADAFLQGADRYTAEVDVDVELHNNYSQQASTLYDDIFAWLTDGMPDTEAQKKQFTEKVQSYFDSLIAEVNLQESTELGKLQEQLDNGFITYDTFVSRSAEVRATADAARSELGTLCSESLAFVENYSGKPASVVQEAYGEIDELERRTNALLVNIGLANSAMTEQGSNAVALTKAGASNDSAVHGLAFEHVSQQYAIDKAQIEQQAADSIAEAERIWRDAYEAAEAAGDEEGMALANERYAELMGQANAEKDAQLAALEASYLTDINALFAGIAKHYPEQAAILQDAAKQIELGNAAQELIGRAFNGENIDVNDLTQPMIDALAQEGIDVQALVDAAGGDGAALSSALTEALGILVENGNAIDMGALMLQTLDGTTMGAALTGVLEKGYLDGISGINTETLEGQLLIVGGCMGDGMVQGIKNQEGRVYAAAQQVANAALSAVRSTWEIKSPSRAFRRLSNNAGETLALGFADKEKMVRDAMYRITDPGALGVQLGGVMPGAKDGSAIAAANAAGAGVVYNITVPNASIRSDSEAKALLQRATKMTNAYNRGLGK